MAYRFQLLLKECTIEASSSLTDALVYRPFQLLLKECTIEANPPKIPGFSSESFSCY